MGRSVDPDFIKAMNEKLEWGRRRGRKDYDNHWNNAIEVSPFFLLDRLLEEVAELTVALRWGNKNNIRSESADIANFVMFIADVHGALEPEVNDEA